MPPQVHPPSTRREWRCRSCRSLLGVVVRGELHVKYKDVEHRIRGACEHQCRRCGAANGITVTPDAARAP